MREMEVRKQEDEGVVHYHVYDYTFCVRGYLFALVFPGILSMFMLKSGRFPRNIGLLRIQILYFHKYRNRK